MASNLLDALNQVTEQDWSDVLKKIEAVESELATLEELQKLIGKRLGKKREKKWPGGRKIVQQQIRDDDDDDESDGDTPSAKSPSAGVQGGAVTEKHRKRLEEYIMANGPTSAIKMFKDCGIPIGSVAGVTNHPLFVKTALGIGLSRNHR